ncbi:MAG: UpxY family transcription antiterminator [Planctomycetes bacterium]|nr:UpxY family transcription antiterminator [Planctomycetota bacterium]
MKWYAVHTRSRHEKQVNAFLVDKGIESFLPLVSILSRRKDRKKYIDLPLFPGYLFAHVDQEQLNHVKYTRGVTKILGSDVDQPTPVPDKQVMDIKTLMESKVKLDPYPYLQKGIRVRVKVGPLKGVEGILVEKKDNCKLVISIDLLQKGTAAEIFITDVEAI